METTKAILEDLRKTLCEQYEQQLARLPMKKNVRECLVDGFKSGVGEGIRHTVQMLGVTVKE